MTWIALGDCQDIQFSPLFFSHDFKIIPNDYEYLLIELFYRLGWLMFSFSYFLLYVPYPGLFPQSFFPFYSGKARTQPLNHFGISDAQTFFSSPFSFISEFTLSLLLHYEILLLFCSSPGLFSLLHFFWLAFLSGDLCFSDSHCQLQNAVAFSLQLVRALSDAGLTVNMLGRVRRRPEGPADVMGTWPTVVAPFPV